MLSIHRVLLLLLLLTAAVICDDEQQADEYYEPPKQWVCLNMIVRDYPAVDRALISASPFYDEIFVTDTGSVDNTIKVMQDTARMIVRKPITITRFKWNGNYNDARNYALKKVPSRCDYVLILDADSEVEPKTTERTVLTKMAYNIQCNTLGTRAFYPRTLLLKNDGKWTWKRRRHEIPVHEDAPFDFVYLEDYSILYRQDTPRQKDPNRWLDDAKAMKLDHQDDPTDARTVFYLALSYGNAGMFTEAITYYKLRISMHGWYEEEYESLNYLGDIYQTLNMPEKLIVETWARASMVNPRRVEVLQKLSQYLRNKGRHAEAYIVALIGVKHMESPTPIFSTKERESRLFLKQFIYEYGMEMEHAAAAWHLGFFHEGYVTSQKLAQLPQLNSEYGDGAAAKQNLRQNGLGMNSSMTFLDPFASNRKRLFEIMRMLPFIVGDQESS